MPLASEINTTLTAVGRPALSAERAAAVAQFMATHANHRAWSMPLGERAHDDMLVDYRAYMSALDEAADPAKLSQRLIWQAEEKERWADSEVRELDYRRGCLQTAIYRNFGADEIADRRATVERLTRVISEWRAEAALLRADAVQAMVGVGQRCAA